MGALMNLVVGIVVLLIAVAMFALVKADAAWATSFVMPAGTTLGSVVGALELSCARRMRRSHRGR